MIFHNNYCPNKASFRTGCEKIMFYGSPFTLFTVQAFLNTDYYLTGLAEKFAIILNTHLSKESIWHMFFTQKPRAMNHNINAYCWVLLLFRLFLVFQQTCFGKACRHRIYLGAFFYLATFSKMVV